MRTAVLGSVQPLNRGCLFGGGCFLRRLDVDMCEAAFAFELLEVVDGVFFARSKHWAARYTKKNSHLQQRPLTSLRAELLRRALDCSNRAPIAQLPPDGQWIA